MRKDWEYKTFGEIGSFLRGKNIQKADFVSGGLPCIHYGQIHTKFDISIDYHLSEIPQEVYDKAIIASPGDVIIAITSEDIDGSCKSVVWLGNYDIAVSAHAAILKHNMNGKFIAYYLRSNTFFTQKLKYARGFKVMEIKTKDLAKLVLPIPPKPTQLSIVSELDKLNELIRIKKEQLKDYDALAQSIFYEMFGDPVENEKGWEVKKLGEVSIYPKERIAIDQICPNQYIGVENLIKDRGGVRFSDNLPKADVAIAYKENDILLGNIRPYLKKIWLADKVGGASGDVVIIRIKERLISPLFLFKLLSSDQFFEYDNNHTKGAKMPRGDRKTIAKFGVILPPLSLQQSFAHKIEQIEQQKAAIQKTITDLETLLAARMQYWFD